MTLKKTCFFLLLTIVPLLGFFACGGGRRPPVVSGADAELKRCLALSEKKKYQEAVECLDVYKSRYPSGDRAQDADLMVADNYYHKKDYTLAAETYQEFIKEYPLSSRLDYAYYQSGISYLKDNPKKIDRDQKNLSAAIDNLGVVVQEFPNSTYSKEALIQYRKARGRLALKDYYVAHFYYKYSEYLAAIPRFEEIVTLYPGLGYDEKSYYYLIHAYLGTDQPDQARMTFKIFEEKYPHSSLMRSVRGKVKRAKM